MMSIENYTFGTDLKKRKKRIDFLSEAFIEYVDIVFHATQSVPIHSARKM